MNEKGDQPMLWPGLDPYVVARGAIAKHQPVATFCLFSGGNDSLVLAHHMREFYDALVFIDTGTALPGVREFVEQTAADWGVALKVYEAGGEYRRMVVGSGDRQGPRRPHGFPGPAAHRHAYIRLKERQVATLIRDHKRGIRDRIMLLTGVRRSESQRRMGHVEPIRRDGAAVWVAPLIDWTDHRMRAYRRDHALPESDVAALMHMSGECGCGAFARPGEREERMAFYPDWFRDVVEPLEREAKGLGLPNCVWGRRADREQPVEVGPLCSDCQLRLETA